MFSDLGKALQMVENLIQELKTLNENLSDLKTMIAPYLGWKVIVKDKEEEKL